MPYCEASVKDALDNQAIRASEPGHLTYQLYRLCLMYVNLKGKRFFVYCEIVGALVCCLLEFYRRQVAKYEDGAIKRNGDVD